MSARYWNCHRDRRCLHILHQMATVMHVGDSFSHGSSEDSSLSSDDDTCEILTLLTLGTVAQFVEVNKVFEDYSIVWEQMKTIEHFNESQCIQHFRFKKKIYYY